MRSCKYAFRMLFLIPALASLGCGDNKSVQGYSSGTEIRIIEKGVGRKVNEGDFMHLDLTYKSRDGKMLFDSRGFDDDFIIEAVKSSYKGSLEECLLMLHEGDSAHFIVSADSVYKYTFEDSLPPNLNSGDQLHIYLRLKKVYDEKALQAERTIQFHHQIEIETQEIEKFLILSGLPLQPVKPGVYYFDLKKGTGTKPVSGDSVFLRYTGRFLNGEVFDGSTFSGRELLSYRLGNGERLVEWERAISTMHVGSVARLILCSPFAYGRTGSGVIPPNTPLVYDIELVRIIPAETI